MTIDRERFAAWRAAKIAAETERVSAEQADMAARGRKARETLEERQARYDRQAVEAVQKRAERKAQEPTTYKERCAGNHGNYHFANCGRQPVVTDFIVLKPGHPVSVRDALEARPDLPPLLALAATHRPLGVALGLRRA